MPMELRLEVMTTIGSNLLDTKRELGADYGRLNLAQTPGFDVIVWRFRPRPMGNQWDHF